MPAVLVLAAIEKGRWTRLNASRERRNLVPLPRRHFMFGRLLSHTNMLEPEAQGLHVL